MGAGGVDLDMFRLSVDRDRDRRLRFILVLYVLYCTVTFERTTYFLRFSQNSDVPCSEAGIQQTSETNPSSSMPIYVCIYVCTLLYPYK